MYGIFVRSCRRQEDWDAVKSVRKYIFNMVANEKEKYCMNLGRKLTSCDLGLKTFWTVFKRLLNRMNVVNVPPLLENVIIVTNMQTNATIFYKCLAQQCSTIKTGSEVPSFYPQCDKTLCDVIDRTKVLRLIRSSDSNKAHGWDGISAHKIKICDFYIVEPLCLSFETCLATGIYLSMWKETNIVPIHKKESRHIK